MALRIDKWLWAVRLFRTRSLAIEACRSGQVKLGAEAVKPAREVRVGEVLSVQTGGVERTVRVKALLERRVGAGLVAEYLEDLTPPEVYAAARAKAVEVGGARARGAGRPTKRERRVLDRFLGLEQT